MSLLNAVVNVSWNTKSISPTLVSRQEDDFDSLPNDEIRNFSGADQRAYKSDVT